MRLPKRQSREDFKGRHFEAWLIVQMVAWNLLHPLSYRDLEKMAGNVAGPVAHL